MERPDDYHPTPRLLASLAAAALIVRLTDHPLVAVALASVAIGLIWVWP